MICYVGDSAPSALDKYPPIFDAEILITEITFFRPEHRREKIHKYGHMHIDDIVERKDKFNNKVILGTHASTRYHERQIRKEFEKRLPDELKDRLELWL